MRNMIVRTAAVLCLFAAVSGAQAADIQVVSSGGFAEAYRALAPGFEQKTGNKLLVAWGPSMGDTHDAVPARLARGEKIDVVIMVGYALATLAKQGTVVNDSQTELARGAIGVVVRQGAPHPDIATVDALRHTLLAAKSVAYSDSASGVYIANEMFKKMGIAEQMAGKARMIPAEPVGGVVARGDAEIGFQQISELKPIKGIDLLGPLPAEVQKYTVFSAGIVAGSDHPAEAAALIRYLASPDVRAVVLDSGMEPLDGK